MNDPQSISRRSFLQNSTTAGVATAAFTIIKPELVRGAGKELLKVGLVGCGGRGAEAVVNLMQGTENVNIVAMGDLFEDKLKTSLSRLQKHKDAPKFADRIKVDPEHRFTGFDAYQKVLASDIDIVMLATPPAYRPIHFEAAVEAGKHVFCEKPAGTDPVNVRRFMAAARKSEERKLTVMSGAQRRSDQNYIDGIRRIQDGEIGDVLALYAFWLGRPVIQEDSRNPKLTEMMWQHRNWYSYLWICGDHIVEQHIHNIDVCNWLMGTHPSEALATGGVTCRGKMKFPGNIYDHFNADFIYPNGVRMTSYCRQFPAPADMEVFEIVVGAKGRTGVPDFEPVRQTHPYVAEHTAMVASIRGDEPYVNHGVAIAESTLTAIMGRESAYSGLTVRWADIMNSQQDLLPKRFAADASIDVPPVPIPGQYKFI
jgi:predicted dehydrogenase